MKENKTDFVARKIKLKDMLFIFGVFSLMEVYYGYTQYKAGGSLFPLIVASVSLFIEIISFAILIPKRCFEDYRNVLKCMAVLGTIHALVFGLIFVYNIGSRTVEKVLALVGWFLLAAIEVVILEVLRRKHMSKTRSERKEFNEAQFKKIFIPLFFLLLLITKSISGVILEFSPLVMSLCCIAFYANFFAAKKLTDCNTDNGGRSDGVSMSVS